MVTASANPYAVRKPDSGVKRLQPCERPRQPVGVTRFDGERGDISPGCGNCDPCIAKWVGALRRRIIDVTEGLVCEWVLVTLTFREIPTPLAATRSWRLLRKRLWKEYGQFSYVYVWELQKRGALHLHLMVPRGVLPEYDGPPRKLADWRISPAAQRFRQLAVESGFGPVSSVEKARKGRRGGASYLSKYLSKGPALRKALRQPMVSQTGERRLFSARAYGFSRDLTARRKAIKRYLYLRRDRTFGKDVERPRAQDYAYLAALADSYWAARVQPEHIAVAVATLKRDAARAKWTYHWQSDPETFERCRREVLFWNARVAGEKRILSELNLPKIPNAWVIDRRTDWRVMIDAWLDANPPDDGHKPLTSQWRLSGSRLRSQATPR